MKQLIISNYDSETNFTWIIIDNGVEVARGGYKSNELKKYGLYDEEWLWFDEKMMHFDKNPLIQEFDMIIYCDNGSIRIYKKYITKKED